MEETVKSVIVIGASGNIGQAITEALLATGQFSVSALTRNTSKVRFPSSVNVIKTDYTKASLVSVFSSQDAVVSAIATDSLMEQQRIIDAALEAGVRRFVPSEFGFDTSTDISLEVAPPVTMKKDVVEYLRSKEDRMSWCTFCCGMWFDWSVTSPLFPFWDLDSHTFTKFDDGTAPFEASNLAQVAKAVAASLLPRNLAVTKNQYVFTHSFTLTQNQVLKAIEEATGTKFDIQQSAVKPLAASGKAKFIRAVSSGKSPQELGSMPDFMQGIVELIIAGCFGNGGVNQFGEQARMWNEKLGLGDEDFEEVVRNVVKSHEEGLNA